MLSTILPTVTTIWGFYGRSRADSTTRSRRTSKPWRAIRDASAHYNLGNAYRAKGEIGTAAECFRRAVESDPEHARALAALGQALQTLARTEEAVPFLREGIVLMPDDADLHCDLGNALQTLGQLPAATAAYRRSLQLNPKLSRAWYAAGCAESSRRTTQPAVACFRRALEIHPGWPEAQHNLGQALFKLGQVEAALDLFRQAAAGGDPALPQAAIAVIIPGSPSSDNQSILDARRTWAERQLARRAVERRLVTPRENSRSADCASATSLPFFKITTG